MRQKAPRLAVAVLVMLLAGFVYAWGVLSAPISADFPQWTNAQLTLTFTLCMAFFCLGGMLSGRLAQKVPVRINLLGAALLFMLGFFLTSKTQSLFTLYLGYGVICGSASGIAYNSTMHVIPRWFPNQQGLISGVLLMGFGASSLLLGTVFTAVLPRMGGDWRSMLRYFGIITAVLVAVSTFWIRPPEKGADSRKNEPADRSEGIAPKQMLRQKSFWLFYGWVIIVSAAGLVIISQVRVIAKLSSPHFGAGAISLVVGLLSVCNGLGRIVFGGLFDRRGHGVAMGAVNAALFCGIALLAAASMLQSAALLVAGAALAGLGYGGGPTMSASVIRLFYGKRHYPLNFSIANSSLLLASFSSTAAGILYDTTGNFYLVFVALLIAVVLAAVVSRQIKQKSKRTVST